MSLSEKAAQLENLADGQEAQAIIAAIQGASTACEQLGGLAAGIIGDMPAGTAANGAWQEAKRLVDEAGQGIQAAQAKLKEIAGAVRQAGSAGF